MYQDTREHERNRRTYAVPESQQRNLRHRRYCGIAESSYAQREWNEDREPTVAQETSEDIGSIAVPEGHQPNAFHLHCVAPQDFEIQETVDEAREIDCMPREESNGQ